MALRVGDCCDWGVALVGVGVGVEEEGGAEERESEEE